MSDNGDINFDAMASNSEHIESVGDDEGNLDIYNHQRRPSLYKTDANKDSQ